MKIAVVSDTHGAANKLIDLKDVFNGCDALCFLGDGLQDLRRAAPYLNTRIIAVSGNNDYGFDCPKERAEKLGELKIFMAHGHTTGVYSSLLGMKFKAEENGCGIALYGHTHIATVDKTDGITFMNPGSLAYPRSNSRPSYGLIEIGDKRTEVKIVFI